MIGPDIKWHHTHFIRVFFERRGDSVTYINGDTFPTKEEPYKIQVENDCPYVFVFQIQNSFEIERDRTKTRVIQYCGETYWKPSCTNPDFLITGIPEMIERYKFQIPQYFTQLKGYMYDRMFIEPNDFDYNAPKNPGVFFQGIQWAGKNEQDFREVRMGYHDRTTFIHEVKDIINILPLDYQSDYIKSLCVRESELVIMADASYMSKRPLENCAAGVINLLYIKDAYQVKYYEELGFFHMKNCYYIIRKEDIIDYLRLSKEQKQSIKENAHKLLLSKFTLHTIWNDWIKWMDKCEGKTK